MSAPVPKYHEYMQPTLKVLASLGGSAAVDEINDGLIEAMQLSEQQLDVRYPTSGALVVTDRMSWARSYLRIAGLTASGGKGVWLLTDAGRDTMKLSPEAVRKLVAQKVKDANAARIASQPDSGAEPAAPEAEADSDIVTWSDQLLAALLAMDPAAFERLCQRLLREYGFTRVEVTGKSGDGGIDGQGVLRVNLVSFHVLFQCKRYKGSVGAGTIRDFRGAMQGRADKGLVITTGTFTPDARREATRDGAPAIDLIDGDSLCELLRDKGLGVTVKPVTTYEISVDTAFFEGI
ncbi:MAG: restriction endonuclease [Janthinobacterium lividum]